MKNITMKILSSIALNSNADTGKKFNAKMPHTMISTDALEQ